MKKQKKTKITFVLNLREIFDVRCCRRAEKNGIRLLQPLQTPDGGLSKTSQHWGWGGAGEGKQKRKDVGVGSK